MLSRLLSDLIVLCANVPDACSTGSISLMSAVANVALSTGDLLRYSPSYAVHEYISQCIPRLDARRFAIIPVCQALTVNGGSEEREKAYEGWRRRWKH